MTISPIYENQFEESEVDVYITHEKNMQVDDNIFWGVREGGEGLYIYKLLENEPK